MNQREFKYWQAVTASSTHRWVEDSIFRLNGRGAMYYTGGENGSYIEICKDGTLTLGDYEGALPHIGEAPFFVKAQKQCVDFNEAFQTACQIGGKKFLMDMFLADQIPQETLTPEDDQDHGLTMNL